MRLIIFKTEQKFSTQKPEVKLLPLSIFLPPVKTLRLIQLLAQSLVPTLLNLKPSLFWYASPSNYIISTVPRLVPDEIFFYNFPPPFFSLLGRWLFFPGYRRIYPNRIIFRINRRKNKKNPANSNERGRGLLICKKISPRLSFAQSHVFRESYIYIRFGNGEKLRADLK